MKSQTCLGQGEGLEAQERGDVDVALGALEHRGGVGRYCLDVPFDGRELPRCGLFGLRVWEVVERCDGRKEGGGGKNGSGYPHHHRHHRHHIN